MASLFVLVGRSHAGKSALFEAFTGTYAAVFEYPGTRVGLAEGNVWIGNRWARVVDTPAVQSLTASSDAERVTRDILLAAPGGVAAVVADANDLQRALVLVIELAELDVPVVLCVNKADEAARRGRTLDGARLSGRLGIPVVSTVAVRREGIAVLQSVLTAAAVPDVHVLYDERVETAAASIARALGGGRRARGLAVLYLAGDQTVRPWIEVTAHAAASHHIADVAESFARKAGPGAPGVADARMQMAAELLRSAGPGAAGRWAWPAGVWRKAVGAWRTEGHEERR